MKRKLTAIFTVILCVAVLFAGCGKKEEKKTDSEKQVQSQADTKKEEQIKKMKKTLEENENFVAIVGDVGVTKEEYNLVYMLNYDAMSQYSYSYGESWYDEQIDDKGTTMGEYIEKSTADLFYEFIVASKIAEENGIVVNEEIQKAVEENIASIKESNGGEEGYKEFLEKYHTTEEALKLYFQRVEIYNKLYEQMTSEGGSAYIKDADLLEEFSKKYMRVQHILIKTGSFDEMNSNGNSAVERTDDEALFIANQVIDRIDSGEDFDSLIETYNEDPGMTAGSFYTFTDGEMVLEFEEESKKLKSGEYSKTPVKTDYGYHIVKKYDVDTECDEFELFKQQKSQEKITGIFEEKKKSVFMETKDDMIDKIIEELRNEMAAETSSEINSEGDSETATTEE